MGKQNSVSCVRGTTAAAACADVVACCMWIDRVKCVSSTDRKVIILSHDCPTRCVSIGRLSAVADFEWHECGTFEQEIPSLGLCR